MRGFNLFATFLGVIMIALAIGYSVFSANMKAEKSTEMMESLARFDAEGVSTVIRIDAYSTVLNKIREDFHEFFATQVIDPPEDVWTSYDRFKEWFENDFSQSETLASWVADKMFEELLVYKTTEVFGQGYDVMIIGSKDDAREAIRRASSIILNDDGTFVYVLDTSKLSAEDYAKLPRIKVVKVGRVSGSTEDVVLPPGKWSIPVNLRIGKAYEVARAVYFDVKNRYSGSVAFAMGHCDPDRTAACGVFTVDPERGFVLLEPDELRDPIRSNSDETPSEVVSPCKYQYINLWRMITENKDIFRMDAEDLTELAKKNLQTYITVLQMLVQEERDEEKKQALQQELAEKQALMENLDQSQVKNALSRTPCRGDKETLLAIANPALQSLTKRINMDILGAVDEALLTGDNLLIQPEQEKYRKYATAVIVRRTAVSPLKMLCEELASGAYGMATQSLAGAITGGATQILVGILITVGIELATGGEITESIQETCAKIGSTGSISFDECKITDRVYCVAPEEVSYIVTWRDPNEEYTTIPGVPAVFSFRQKLGRPPVLDRLKQVEKSLEDIEEQSEKYGEDAENVEKLDNETLAAVKEVLPYQLDTCYMQYASTYLQCNELTYTDPYSGEEKLLTQEELNRILSSVEIGENASPDDVMNKFCEVLEQYNIAVPGITVEDGTGVKVCEHYGTLYDLKKGIEDIVPDFLENLAKMAENFQQRLCKSESTGARIVRVLNPAQMAICTSQNIKEDADAMATAILLDEYNSLYYGTILPTVRAGAIGACSPEAEDENKVSLWNNFQTYFSSAEPQDSPIGPGMCHPDGLAQWIVNMARQKERSVLCKFEPEALRNRVLFETLWLHQGQEIYASCSQGEMRP